MTDEKKSLDYLENILEVHEIYKQALQARQQLAEDEAGLHDLRAKRTGLEMLLKDEEMEVAERLRSAHPDWSVAEWERRLKAEIHKSTGLTTLRERIREVQDDIDLKEYQIRLVKVDISIATSRMQELAGLLQFMAVLKSNSEAKKSQATPTETGNPWS